MFFLEIFAARGFQKPDTRVVQSKKMRGERGCQGQIYRLLKINYLCVPTQGLFPAARLGSPVGRKPSKTVFCLLPVCTIQADLFARIDAQGSSPRVWGGSKICTLPLLTHHRVSSYKPRHLSEPVSSAGKLQ